MAQAGHWAYWAKLFWCWSTKRILVSSSKSIVNNKMFLKAGSWYRLLQGHIQWKLLFICQRLVPKYNQSGLIWKNKTVTIYFSFTWVILSHWFSGTSVNFADPKQIARANGRELVRVETVSITHVILNYLFAKVGKIRVQFQIITTNMLKFGYNVGKPET